MESETFIVQPSRSTVQEAESFRLEHDARKTEDRNEWGHPTQFFFTVLGFCVGLGNIWRFPYLCQAHGGGSFVVAFLVMLVIEGMPLLLLELAVGQKFRTSSYGVWGRIHPKLSGIGLGSAIIAAIVGCYYNVIISWCLFYLFQSLSVELPWSLCPLALTTTNETSVESECAKSSETQYFWYRRALDISDSVTDLGGIKWWMLLCLVISWVVVYLIVMKGIQSSGKVVYFTALFPYVVLTIFLVRGLTLQGSVDGLRHMFYPKLDKLLSPTVWLEAANQVFYSYGLALGSIVGFGSYNPKKKNCVLDSYMISLCNAFTAIFASAVVFTILGFKAHLLFQRCLADAGQESSWNASMTNFTLRPETLPCSMSKELNNAAQGTGLAFIVMADVFKRLPWAPLWSFLFFAMLLALGLGSQIGIMEGVIGTLFDIPRLKTVRKPIISGIACAACFLVGVLFVTGAGEYWLTLFDTFGATGLSLIALAEILAVTYIYGHERFTADVLEMTGTRPGWYWQVTWRFVAPLFLAIVLGSSLYSKMVDPPTYFAWNSETGEAISTAYPWSVMLVASFLAVASIIPIVTNCLLVTFRDRRCPDNFVKVTN